MGMKYSKPVIVHHNDNFNYYGEIKYVNDTDWIADGQGRCDWYDDDYNVYIGEFKNNMANGYGTCSYSDKSIYYGNWKNNLKHGRGKIIFNDNSEYTGTFSFDLLDGHGEYKYNDGYIYKGEIHNNKLLGKGKLYSPDNKLIYSGEWFDNVFQGEGIYYFPNGIVQYNGRWRHSLAHGRGILYNENGNILWDGFFKDGEKYYEDYKSSHVSEKKIGLLRRVSLCKNKNKIPEISTQINNKIIKSRVMFNPLNISRVDLPGVINPLEFINK
jgi:hypothetical protein